MARIWQNGFESGRAYAGSYNGTYLYNNYKAISSVSYSDHKFGIASVSRGGLGTKSFCTKPERGSSAALNYIEIPFKDTQEAYIRMYIRVDFVYSGSQMNFMRFLSGSTSYFDIKRKTDTNGTILCVYNNATSANLKEDTISNGMWYKVDIHFKLSTVNGIIELKIDNNTILKFEGNTLGSLPTTGLNKIQIGSNINGDGSSLYNENIVYIDDMAINDTSGTSNNSWVGDSSIIDIRPSANGSVVQFTPSSNTNVANVSEISQDTTSLNTASEPNIADLFVMSTITGIPQNTVPNAINIATYSMAENLYLSHLVKANGTVSEVATHPNNGTWKFDNTILEKDTSGNPLTVNYINSIEVGYKSKDIS